MLGLTRNKQEPVVLEPAFEGEIPRHLRPDGPDVYGKRHRQLARLAELEPAFEQQITAPPPLSEEARRMIDDQRIKRAEIVRDTQRATAAARLAEFDAWVVTRLREMEEEVQEFNRYAEARRAELATFSDRVYAWGDDHVAKVTAEQAEQARLHARDVDIVTATQALLEKHGVPLPPPKPAQPAVLPYKDFTEQGEEHGAEAESKE